MLNPVSDPAGFMRARKKTPADAPLVLVPVLPGTLMVPVDGSALAPFIHTLF